MTAVPPPETANFIPRLRDSVKTKRRTAVSRPALRGEDNFPTCHSGAEPTGPAKVAGPMTSSFGNTRDRWQSGMTTLQVHARGKRVLLDEHTARLDLVAHQFVEDRVGFVDLLDADLQE